MQNDSEIIQKSPVVFEINFGVKDFSNNWGKIQEKILESLVEIIFLILNVYETSCYRYNKIVLGFL